MIYSQELQFSYNQHRTFQFPNITCQNKETLLILGQSGKGKTTLLHLLALLIKPESGKIVIDDQDLTQISSSDAAKVRSKLIGIIYQKPHFVSALSVLDNLLLANYLAKEKENKVKAQFLAEHLGFEDHLHKKTSQLSQGEQQRVSIARALMNKPRVILADEPTSSLDDTNCHKVIELLRLQSELIGASLLVVTHDQRLKNEFSNQIVLG